MERFLTIFLLLIRFGDSNHLWDLNNDPTETINLYNDSTYEELRNQLFDRLVYWQGKLVGDDDSDTLANTDEAEKIAYAECGGVCPYVNDTYSLEIQQIYYPTDPPHIIFVLVDDWGYNDIGFRSTYMNWTTPTIDKLASEGIILDNYFTHDYCTPSRAALMTGRFPGRMGMLNDMFGEFPLPLSEVTLAQELKSAGYETKIVGKWGLGHTSLARLPTYRGFDTSYGYYMDYIDYYTKQYNGYLDLHNGIDLVTDETELSESYHSALLFNKKVEDVIIEYATNGTNKPLFLYYASQLVHGPYEAPSVYIERCVDANSTTASVDDYTYCAMNVMLDKSIANLTCLLDTYDMLNNTVFIIASDNGGADSISGNSVPFRGHKYDLYRGGLSVNAFITSPLIPEDRRGTVYSGQMHVSDWLPTIMSLVTYGEWTGGYTDNTIDGKDMWNAILSDTTSPHKEIMHSVDSDGAGSIQINIFKPDIDEKLTDYDNVTDYFPVDLAPLNARNKCSDPYIVTSDDDDYSTNSVTAAAFQTVAPSEEQAHADVTSYPTEEVHSAFNLEASDKRLHSQSRRTSAANAGIERSLSEPASTAVIEFGVFLTATEYPPDIQSVVFTAVVGAAVLVFVGHAYVCVSEALLLRGPNKARVQSCCCCAEHLSSGAGSLDDECDVSEEVVIY